MRTDGEEIVALLTEIRDRLPEPTKADPAPADVDPDEALAMVLNEIMEDDWLTIDLARAAREHIKAEGGSGGAWKAAAVSAHRERKKAEAAWEDMRKNAAAHQAARWTAEADVERLTRERDEARHHHEALRADVDEFQYKHREYPGTWELVVALGRDIERRQA